MSEILPSDAFDFSKYRSGDVIVVTDGNIIDMGLTNYQMLWKVIDAAAAAHDLHWRCDRDEANAAFRITIE